MSTTVRRLTRHLPVVRAELSDDAVWGTVKEMIAEPTVEGFGADVEFVEERSLAGLDEAAIAGSYPRAYMDYIEFATATAADGVFAASDARMFTPDETVATRTSRRDDSSNRVRF